MWKCENEIADLRIWADFESRICRFTRISRILS